MTDLSELKDSKGNKLLNSRQIRNLEDAGITTIEMLNTLTKRELKEIRKNLEHHNEPQTLL